jgi:hypothetical protein
MIDGEDDAHRPLPVVLRPVDVSGGAILPTCDI